MNCPKCKSSNVNVQVITESMRTRNRGCLWTLGRMILIVCTFGLWLIIGSAKSKSKMQNHKEAICQNCGYSWKV